MCYDGIQTEIDFGNEDFHLGIYLDNKWASKIPVDNRCDNCAGTGNEFLFMYKCCSKCGGTGEKNV